MKLLGDLVGTTLSNRYRLHSRIAGGGMGEVYRGHDLLLDRRVAVKVLQPSLAADPELVQRFKQEARAAARLSHPNVVQVHDWGSERESTYYMVMEYVPGRDLRDVLVGRGPLEPAHAAEIVACVCDALHAAHLGGLVHRDVKPENVLISRGGVVKVTDFGIAAVADAERSQTGGTILGTLRYLSPEQAAGEEATKASDVWAAGAVLFELLIGSPPHSGSGGDLLRRRALEAPVAPSSLEPRIPQAIDAVVVKACALDPAERYESAAVMAHELRAAAPRHQPVEELLADLTGEVKLPDMQPTSFVGRSALKRRYRNKIRWRLMKLSLLAILLLGIGVGGVKAASAVFGPQEVQVPSVAGLSLAAAGARAEEVGLELEVTARRRSPQAPAGFVLSQAPEDGVLLEGKAVEVVVSAGPPLAKVPSLRGMEMDEAMEALEERHLAIGSVNRQYSHEEPETVIGQDPKGGKLEWGKKVYLVVSKGPRSLPIPGIDGLTARKAEELLAAKGFVVRRTEAYSDEVPAGDVMYTTPAEGALATEGSEVQLFISIGPEFKELTLPDVRGMNVGDAKALLQDKGLRVEVTRSCGPGGTVVAETSPVAGSTVKENQVVALFIC